MAPWDFEAMTFTLHHGDCLAILKTMPDNSVDSIVTDPPYGLGKEPDALAMLKDWMTTGHHDVRGKGFMGKDWDAFVPQPAVWRECLRVLKPGGHLLSFAGTRTQDLVCLGLRLAGFEIRDMLAWVYGSGFPKSLDVSKALDKMAGAEREVVGQKDVGPDMRGGNFKTSEGRMVADITAPATEAAHQWQGWGTALKPALEPITLARKPLAGNVASTVLEWGTGALNIEGCRVGNDMVKICNYKSTGPQGCITHTGVAGHSGQEYEERTSQGRFPANFIHDGSDDVLDLFPVTKSGNISPHHIRSTDGGNGNTHGKMAGVLGASFGDQGSAARFFYCAKASKADRDEGCESLPPKEWRAEGACIPERGNRPFEPSRNNHPTVKPASLMRYLCRLITPAGGLVLDPYMGSGSTGKAAMLEGFRFAGIEQDAGYLEIARARISHAEQTMILEGL